MRGVGDFTSRIQTIFVDLDWLEPGNQFEQTKSQALSGASPFFDWTFPVINDAGGKLTYKATTAFKDGTSAEVPIRQWRRRAHPPAAPGGGLPRDPGRPRPPRLDRGEAGAGGPGLRDTQNGVVESKDLIFSATSHAAATWRVELKDRTKDEYTYSVTYYLVEGLQKKRARSPPGSVP